jgi:hypothetical protein
VKACSRYELYRCIQKITSEKYPSLPLGFDIADLPDKPYLVDFLYWLDNSARFFEPT